MKVSILYSKVFNNRHSEEILNEIRKSVPNVTIEHVTEEIHNIDTLLDSEVIFGSPPPAELKKLKNLKWLHILSAGADNYINKDLYANPTVILTKSSGTYGIPIAEHIIGMMLALSRNLTSFNDNQKSGLWKSGSLKFLDLYGSTVIVLGLGDIGTELSKRLAAFGCNIIGFRHNTSISCQYAKEILPISDFRKRLHEADYIAVCLPGTESTKNLISFEEFALMKQRAIITNIGRGTIINTDALLDALTSRKIKGAGLDVTDPEPLPADHPLWCLDNVLITPHVSGFSTLNDDRRLRIFGDLLSRYVKGEPLYNVVDFKWGY
jgi:phosphoglycerate dehydrogenase-like enzyme